MYKIMKNLLALYYSFTPLLKPLKVIIVEGETFIFFEGLRDQIALHLDLEFDLNLIPLNRLSLTLPLPIPSFCFHLINLQGLQHHHQLRFMAPEMFILHFKSLKFEGVMYLLSSLLTLNSHFYSQASLTLHLMMLIIIFQSYLIAQTDPIE